MRESLDAPSGGLGASDFGVESLIELCMIRVRQSSPVPILRALDEVSSRALRPHTLSKEAS